MKKAKRVGSVTRKTRESSVKVTLSLDGSGKAAISTGVGFLDHMLTLLARHGFLDLDIKARGDLQVDSHHTVEDVGIALGEALKDALGSKSGIFRYGHFQLPMDETLAEAVLDLSDRPYFVYDVKFPRRKMKAGEFDVDLLEEFFRAFATNAGINLHLRLHYGRNVHHIAEALFKALGRAIGMAVAYDTRVKGIPSTKGKL